MRATVGSWMMKASSMADSGKKVLEHHTNNAVGMLGIDLKLVCVQIQSREGAKILSKRPVSLGWLWTFMLGNGVVAKIEVSNPMKRLNLLSAHAAITFVAAWINDISQCDTCWA